MTIEAPAKQLAGVADADKHAPRSSIGSSAAAREVLAVDGEVCVVTASPLMPPG